MTHGTAAVAAVAAAYCMCNRPTVGVAGTYKVTVKESERRGAESCLDGVGWSFPSALPGQILHPGSVVAIEMHSLCPIT